MKLAFIDTETTGTDPRKNDIWQIGVILTVHGQIVCRSNLEFQPVNMQAIDSEALAVGKTSTGEPLTREYLSALQPPRTGLFRFLQVIGPHVNRYEKNDNFKIVAHNAHFDKDFLYNWFRKNGDNYFHSFFSKAFIDTLALVRTLYCLDRFVDRPANLQLGTVCKYLGVSLSNAHNALADCEAVKEIWEKHLAPIFDNVWLYRGE